MMAAYNPNKRLNLSNTYTQSFLNFEGLGEEYSVNKQTEAEYQATLHRQLEISVKQAEALYVASNGAINLFLDNNDTKDMDRLTGEIILSGELAEFGHPGKRLSESQYLVINKERERRKEAKMFNALLQVSQKKEETPVVCWDGEVKDAPRLEGYHDLELRYVVSSRGKTVLVNQIAQRRDELRLLIKQIIKELEGLGFKFEILKWTIEVTYKLINGVVYAHPHLNLIIATEHLTEEQEELWKLALHEAVDANFDVDKRANSSTGSDKTDEDETDKDNESTGNYIRDCGVVKDPNACLMYITKSEDAFLKYISMGKKAAEEEEEEEDIDYDRDDYRDDGDYSSDEGKKLLLHELPPKEFLIAYRALYTTAGSKPKTSGRGPTFRKFRNFFEDNGLNIKARKNKFGYTEYVPVFKDLKKDPATKEEEKKKRKKKKKKVIKKEEKKTPPVNYVVHYGCLFPDATKGIMNNKMKIAGFDKNKNMDFPRQLVEETRAEYLLKNPNAVLPEIHDNVLTNEEREERRIRAEEKAARDALVKEREKLGKAYLAYTIFVVLYQTDKNTLYIMSSLTGTTFPSLFSSLASLKYYAPLPQYDFVDVAIKFIQIHANAPPPCMNKTKTFFFSLAQTIGVKKMLNRNTRNQKNSRNTTYVETWRREFYVREQEQIY